MIFRARALTFAASLALSLAAAPAGAQDATAQSTPAPTLMRIDGEHASSAGKQVWMRVSVYAAQDDTTPLWFEDQQVTVDATGKYVLFAGATEPAGLPREHLSSGNARWVGVSALNESDHMRFMLLAVPYAMRAFEADTIAGRPAEDFVLNTNLEKSIKEALNGTTGEGGTDPTISATINAIPKFTNTAGTTFTDSSMFDLGGYIGIGTTSPDFPLSVNGEVASVGADAAFRLARTSGATFLFQAGAGSNPTALRNVTNHGLSMWTNNTERMRVDTAGNVGIGTTAPDYKLAVNGEIASIGADASFRLQRDGGATFIFQAGSGTAATALRNITNNPLSLWTNNTERIRIDTSGNVGIGTTTPNAKLQVAGDVTVDGNIGAKYQDVAEWVDSPVDLEPGTVVIVDPSAPNRVIAASIAYDTRIAGAVSPQPGLILGERGEGREMVAQSGRVRIKVDATYGAIKNGDLLVTSPTPGHAMLSKPIKVGKALMHRPGTIVGRALEALPNGKGEILVLLALQ